MCSLKGLETEEGSSKACVERDWGVGTTVRMGSRPGYQADISG